MARSMTVAASRVAKLPDLLQNFDESQPSPPNSTRSRTSMLSLR
jgi:hypothetical protein